MALQEVEFGKFLRRQRMQKNITEEQLYEGLYSGSMIYRVEEGICYPTKLVRDCLLARMGESGSDYECFLSLEEYNEWKKRRIILDCLDNRELEKAKLLIDGYRSNNEEDVKVTEQFRMAMRLQLLELQGGLQEERGRLLEEAIKLTVPQVDTKHLSELLLSKQEINLALEYWMAKSSETAEQRLFELFSYVKERRFDLESRAMLGSKIALYYSNFKLKRISEIQNRVKFLQEATAILTICTQGMEWLRDNCKTYFAWELLKIKNTVLNLLLGEKELLDPAETVVYEVELEETKQFFGLLSNGYEKCGLPKETCGYTCFYREPESYCVNDVIRARRKMLGISREEMALLCSESTIKRLECNKVSLHSETAQKLLDRLNLSMELHRAQIVTNNQDALRVEKEYRKAHNQRNYKEAACLLQELKQKISMKHLINWQYVYYGETILAYELGELSREEFFSDAVEALEYTIPLDIAMKKIKDIRLKNGRIQVGEKYLTNMEVTILKNLADEIGTNKKNKYLDVIQEYFTWLEDKCTLAPILSMYGFTMTMVASYYGNMGNYEESNKINKKIVRESLRLHDVTHVRRNYYGLMWNNRKQQGLPMDKEDPEWKQVLLNCLAVETYCKNNLGIKWIKSKLEL